MTTPEPFDAGPDQVLGRLLREHLDPGGHDAFAARVVMAARRSPPVWDVLARWTRAGIAAAALIGGIVALGSRTAGLSESESLSFADAIAPASMLSADSAAVPGGALASLLEER
jgi:hypothetical protein